MKAARIAVPGILLGSYPERRSRETPSLAARVIAATVRGSAREQLRRCHAFVGAVRALQPVVAGESDQALRERTVQLRAQLARDGLEGDALIQAFAVVAVACRRVLGVDPYDTQLYAASLMIDGHLAEMATGEGKTLAAAVAAASAALAGIPVHVVTANDYLVARDAAHLRALYEALGLTAGAVTQPMAVAERRAAYACDITYCTAKELVFDYLRDGVAAPRRSALEQRAAELSGAQPPQRLLRGLCMAIIDEADSILIDEARVPLVLSQAVADPQQANLQCAWKFSARLLPVTHFQLDRHARSAQLTPAGRAHLRAMVTLDSGQWLNTRHCEDAVTQALTARHLLRRGRDFVVEDGLVHIVDETTGRKAPGRSWSRGLHQLVEIKEGCAPSAQVATLAQITYQCFFPRYFRLCGMSGTLLEARRELQRIYDLQVVRVPLRRPDLRVMLPARVAADAGELWPVVVARVRELYAQGRPVLVGTDSVLDSQTLSRHLTAGGLPHALLNASQDQREAEIVAAAGAPCAITVATNMAGRGTDILLHAASLAAGGLHVISCQQNASRRMDRQLIGRCARQGDPGSAEMIIALDGPLMTPLLMQNRAGRVVKKVFKNKQLWLQWLAPLLLVHTQRAAERRHHIARVNLMRQDRRVNDWFAFSGAEQ